MEELNQDKSAKFKTKEKNMRFIKSIKLFKRYIRDILKK